MTDSSPARRLRAIHPLRWSIHLGALVISLALASTMIVWPRWVEMDALENAIQMQEATGQEIENQIELTRRLVEQQRNWSRHERRVFLSPESSQIPGLARQAARHSGAQLIHAELTNRPSRRWGDVQLEMLQTGGMAQNEARIEARLLFLEMEGDFSSLYRSLGMLFSQQQAIVPEKWEIRRAGGGNLRAAISATVFLVTEEESTPAEPGPQVEIRG